MSLVLTHANKYTDNLPPRYCHSLDLPPHSQPNEESEVLTLGDILSDFQDPPHKSLKDIIFSQEDHYEEKRNSMWHATECTMRNNAPEYQIQIQGASIGEILDDHKNRHFLSTYSSQVMPTSEVTSKTGKDIMESEAPIVGSPLLLAIPVKNLRPEMISLETPETLRLCDSDRLGNHILDKFGSPKTVGSKKSVSENGRSDGDPSEEAATAGLSSHTNEALTMKKKWTKLSNVVHSLGLMKRQEVKMIRRTSAIQSEIEQFPMNNLKVLTVDTVKAKQVLMEDEQAGDAFDLIRRIQVFSDCAAIGSPDHAKHMTKMIQKDPKRFMLEPFDPEHFLNKKNNRGWTPLYIAARNGNLNITKILIESKADPNIKSKVYWKGELEEIPLQAAAKWGHANVVEYLLKSGTYGNDILQNCLKIGSSATVKALLRDHLGQNGKSRSIFDVVCGCWNR